MKLVVFVLAGVVATFAAGQLIATCFLGASPGVRLQCPAVWWALVIFIPVSLLLGSIVTGFLSCPTLNNKWGLLVMAPGLYFAGLLFISVCLSGMPDVTTLMVVLYWYLASLAGVGVGYLLRACIRRYLLGRPD